MGSVQVIEMGAERSTTRELRDLAGRMVATVREPLAVLDAELRVLFVNGSFERLFATTAEAVQGELLSELARQRWAVPQLHQLLVGLAEDSTEVEEHELDLELPELGKRTLLVRAQAMDRDTGEDATILLALEDISAYRLAEHQLRSERDTFRVELDMRNRELANERVAHERTAELLRHADRLATVGRLAAGLVHELGTPLNVVSARAKLIERGQVAGAAIAHNAQIIAEQAERMTKLLRRMLDFSRRRQAARHSDDIGALVGATLTVLEPLARARGVTLACDAPNGAIDVDADATEVQQVITNLVVNAIDAQPDGGSAIVTVCSGAVSPPGQTSAIPCAIVTVTDQGPGIPPELLERLFEPFFTTKAPGQGTGLGLAVCRDIVEEAGGWMEVRTAHDQGTSVLVHLRLATPG